MLKPQYSCQSAKVYKIIGKSWHKHELFFFNCMVFTTKQKTAWSYRRHGKWYSDHGLFLFYGGRTTEEDVASLLADGRGCGCCAFLTTNLSLTNVGISLRFAWRIQLMWTGISRGLFLFRRRRNLFVRFALFVVKSCSSIRLIRPIRVRKLIR